MLTRREALVAAAALTSLPRLSAASPELTLSTFSIEVTCPIGHPCMGGGIAPAKEILDPLFANGFVLRGAGKPVVLIAVDWCEIRNGAYEAWRTAIANAVETDPVRVILSSLHQHDTPIADLEAEELLRKHKAAGSICDLDFHAKTVERVAKEVKKSLAIFHTITHIGTGKATVEKVASNRRFTDAAGIVRYTRMSASRDAAIRDAEVGTIDPELKTLSFWNGDTPIAAVSAYATHPMSFYGRGGVTADFVGLARKRRQVETPGCLQIYLSGCSGNVTAGKYNDGSPDNRPALADRMFKAMTAAWKETKKSAFKQVSFRSETISLEARTGKGFTEDDLLARVKADPKPFGQCLAALGWSWLKRVQTGRKIDLPVLDFGDAALTLLPAEAYVEFQLFAQQQRPNDFVITSGYGECGPGYIPIERAWKENDGNLSDWCWVNPGSEDRVNATIRKALRTL